MPARAPSKSEEIFRNEIFGFLPNLISTLWYFGSGHKEFAENVLDSIHWIKAGLEKLETQVRVDGGLPPKQ